MQDEMTGIGAHMHLTTERLGKIQGQRQLHPRLHLLRLEPIGELNVMAKGPRKTLPATQPTRAHPSQNLPGKVRRIPTTGD